MVYVVLQRAPARLDGSLDNRFQDARVAARGTDEADAGATPVVAFNKRISAALDEGGGQLLIGRVGHRSTLAHDVERSDA